MQNCAEIAQVQKLLCKEICSIAFDEGDEPVPFAFGGKAFDDAQRSVRLWASQRLSCDSVSSCSASTSIASDGRDV